MTAYKTNKQKNKIFTIPNILSFFRLCLIPVLVWLYVKKQDNTGALLILLLSALTDIIDGKIARKLDMVSDFGKIFDPIADKLTQITMLACLVLRFHYMLVPLAFLVIKELFTGICSLISVRKTKIVRSADWHGKVTTVVLYATIALHLLWPSMPGGLSVALTVLCDVLMVLSFVLYAYRNYKDICANGNQ